MTAHCDFATLVHGFICAVSVFAAEDNQDNQVCYNAKTCIHNSKEKCGVDKSGEYRRFFDTCDMIEYNCLRSKKYKKTSKKNCGSLPPLDPEHRKHN
ncbi:hypothetical protein evm_001955 [Chilo suppressalis]|nr:hypothetical protein evm_001955 [Chilo suppressalis]